MWCMVCAGRFTPRRSTMSSTARVASTRAIGSAATAGGTSGPAKAIQRIHRGKAKRAFIRPQLYTGNTAAPRESPGAGAVPDCAALLLDRDRDLHAQRLVGQAEALVDAFGSAGERHVIVVVGVDEQRALEVVDPVGHGGIQHRLRAGGDRILVERNVVRATDHVDEPNRGAGGDGQGLGLERRLAGAVARHLHLDHGTGRSGRGGRRGRGRRGGRRRGSRVGILVTTTARRGAQRHEHGQSSQTHRSLPPKEYRVLVNSFTMYQGPSASGSPAVLHTAPVI